MPYTSIHIHIVFSTNHRESSIHESFEGRLHAYLGGIIRNLGAVPLEINGIEDHVHILTGAPPRVSVSELIGKTKSNSSRWINEERLTPRKFRWQTEYGAFSVSRSNVDAVREYIRGQKEHHRRITFREELMTLLRRHEVEFDPRFV